MREVRWEGPTLAAADARGPMRGSELGCGDCGRSDRRGRAWLRRMGELRWDGARLRAAAARDRRGGGNAGVCRRRLVRTNPRVARANGRGRGRPAVA